MSSSFKVGDRVRVPLGRRRLSGVITEDRGAIGSHGRHLYQVLIPMDPFEPSTLELPGEEMELMDMFAEPGSSLDRSQVENYLTNGGLIAILRSNLSGGRSQPRVWLRTDSIGNITHTFERERGVIGGEAVPFFAIHENRIFSPKREDVISFLKSFRLEQSDAEKIIDSVGTAP